MLDRRDGVVLMIAATLLWSCAAVAPLREPPTVLSQETFAGLTTRAEAIARLGPPLEVRASDLGEVLVYRRLVVAQSDPSRYYGLDRGTRFDRYERVLLYLDDTGRIVRWTSQPE